MSDPIRPPTSDDTQEVRGNMAGTKGSFYGNEADSHDARRPRHVHVGHDDGGTAAHPDPVSPAPEADIPDDAGRRAYVDQKTGAVRGAGAGAGGGHPGDEIDGATPAGGGE